MKKIKKSIIALTAILMILSVPLSAAEMSVRWAWALDDPAVTLYRYQLGGEDEDGWTELPASSSSVEIEGLAAEEEHTLYLQRSYDGVNWSPSAVSTAKADLDSIPDVRVYRYGGYELTAEIRTGEVTLFYPEEVTSRDAEAFIAAENEKYDLSDSGITYTLSSPGTIYFSYPLEISRETVAAELDVFVNDLVAYITTPAPVPVVVPEPEPVVVPEPPVVKTYEYGGYTLTATIDTGATLLEYPAFVADDDVNAFFAAENEKYGLASLGVAYAFGEDGEVTVTYPEEYSKETVAAELDKLVADLIAYITTPVPALEPEPVPEPEPVVIPEPPVVKTYEYGGYTLTATIDTGATLLEYPAFVTDDDVNAFFAVENEKYGLADFGVAYAFGEDGEVTVTYPEKYSKETVAAELDKLVADLIAYLTTPVAEPEPVPVIIPEPVADAPIVRTYEYGDYALMATIDTGATLLEYPAFITDDEVNTFFAAENEKYGLAALGVAYAFGEDGEVTVTYPEEYAKETVAAELDKLVDDLLAILPIIRVYEHAGYTLTATIDTGATLLEYPAFVTDDEVSTFFAVENEKYGLAALGVVYAFGEEGEVTVTYPEEYSKETVAAELDKLVADLIAYITPPEPAVPVIPVIPSESVMPAEEDESAFEFSLLLRAGVLSSFDSSFKFDDVIFANLGLGFDFSNIISGGDHFGLGLRSDITLSFFPKDTGKWDLENVLDYFNIFVYGEMVSMDLKLMMDFYAGCADIYIGGGAGIAVGNPYDAPFIGEYLTLDTIDIGPVRFSLDWFASATAGIRFRTSDLFSIGAEVNYRYMVTSEKHIGSADIIMGFSF